MLTIYNRLPRPYITDSFAKKVAVCTVATSIILIFILFNVANWQFYTDDAFITLRYAKNLAEGAGIVWNTGDPVPVEGYSNFLYVIIGTLFEWLSVNTIASLKILNLVTSALTLILLYKLARFWVKPQPAIFAPLILVIYPGFVFWSNSGLETPTYMFLLLCAVISFFRGMGYRSVEHTNTDTQPCGHIGWMTLAGGSVFLCALLRPEGGLIGICIGLAYLVYLVQSNKQHPIKNIPHIKNSLLYILSNKGMWALLLSFLIPFSIYFFWRYSYFGKLFPNTVYCKAGYTGDPFALIEPFLQLAAVFIFGTLLGIRSHLNVKSLTLILFILTSVAILYNVDPIIGGFNRHTLAAFMFVAVLFVVSMSTLSPSIGIKPLYSGLIVISLCFLLVFCIYKLSLFGKLNNAAKNYQLKMDARREVGLFLNQNLAPTDWAAVGDCGMIPYTTFANIYDTYCLNSREFVSPAINKDKKQYAKWVLLKKPKAIIMASRSMQKMEHRAKIDSFFISDEFFTKSYKLAAKYGHNTFNYWIYIYNGPEIK